MSKPTQPIAESLAEVAKVAIQAVVEAGLWTEACRFGGAALAAAAARLAESPDPRLRLSAPLVAGQARRLHRAWYDGVKATVAAPEPTETNPDA